MRPYRDLYFVPRQLVRSPIDENGDLEHEA
jgi:hypothetical protein